MGADTAERGTAAGLTWPTRPRRFRLLPSLLVGSRVPGRRVGLTFDDGPHPVHTRAVLARLAEHGVAAGFFAVGRYVVRHPEVVAETAAAGHRVGLHSFVHEPLGRWDVAGALAEVRAGRDALQDAGAEDYGLYRPPLGRLNPAEMLAAWRFGYRLMGWSLDSNDWRVRSADEAIRCGAETAAAARPGDVILLHDGSAWVGTVLDVLLPALAERGLV